MAAEPRYHRIRHTCGHEANLAFDGPKMRQLATAGLMRARPCLACLRDRSLAPVLHVDRDHHIVDASTYAEVHLALAQALAAVRREEGFPSYLAAVPVARRSHQRIERRRRGVRAVLVHGEWIEGPLLESGMVRCPGILGAQEPGGTPGEVWISLPRNAAAVGALVEHLSRAGARIVDHRGRRPAPAPPAEPGAPPAPVVEVATEPPPLPTFPSMLHTLDSILASWGRTHPAWPVPRAAELAAQEAARLQSLRIDE